MSQILPFLGVWGRGFFLVGGWSRFLGVVQKWQVSLSFEGTHFADSSLPGPRKLHLCRS